MQWREARLRRARSQINVSSPLGRLPDDILLTVFKLVRAAARSPMLSISPERCTTTASRFPPSFSTSRTSVACGETSHIPARNSGTCLMVTSRQKQRASLCRERRQVSYDNPQGRSPNPGHLARVWTNTPAMA